MKTTSVRGLLQGVVGVFCGIIVFMPFYAVK